jgi:hypothetical protein
MIVQSLSALGASAPAVVLRASLLPAVVAAVTAALVEAMVVAGVPGCIGGAAGGINDTDGGESGSRRSVVRSWDEYDGVML